MSLDAVNWAGRQTVGRTTGKAVLVALAHYANGKGLAWPSVAELVAFTEIRRRSLFREMAKLKRANLIDDSGERRGRTKQIKVWKLALDTEELPFPSKKGDSRRTLSRSGKSDNVRHSFNGKGPEPSPAKSANGGNGIVLGPERVTPVTPGTSIGTNSDSNESGGGLAADPVKLLFEVGVRLLVETGQTEKAARSFLGLLRKGRGDGEVLTALLDCRARAISNPVQWLSKRLKPARYVSPSGYEYRGTLEQIRRKADERRDLDTYWAVERELREQAELRKEGVKCP